MNYYNSLGSQPGAWGWHHGNGNMYCKSQYIGKSLQFPNDSKESVVVVLTIYLTGKGALVILLIIKIVILAIL